MRYQTVRWWLLMAAVLLLAACIPRPQPAAPPLPPQSQAQLLDWLSVAGRRHASLATMAKTRVTTPERAFTFQQALLVARPDRLRAEVLSPFGMPLLQLAASDGQLQVYIPSEGRFLAGAATPENLGRFTGLPLTPETLIGLVLQQVPYDAGLRGSAEASAAGYLLTLADGERGGIRQCFTFAPDGQLLRAAYYRADSLALEVVYTRAQSADLFPPGLSLSWPAEGITMNMTFAESDTASMLSRERFVLQPPAGIEILPIP